MITTLIFMTHLVQAEPAAVKPTDSQAALYAALKVREDAPACDSLAVHSTDLANDLVWLVDNATQPPWVGIRAAECVVKHHHTAQAELIKSWMVSPEQRGLAILTLGLLDQLPADLSQQLKTAALAGPLADEVKQRTVAP
jgi:hypothetical protein